LDFTAQQLTFIAIFVLAFTLLITEWIRNDVVALLIILALAVTGVLTPAEAMSGFGSEPAIIVVSIFVISGAFYQTGLAERMGFQVARLAGTSYSRVLAVIMASASVLSIFSHHVTTTALMLPITLDLSRERKIPASKLLIPLSFAASLGTTIIIISAPAFLIASDVLQQAGRPALGIFSIAPIGVCLVATGIVFMLLAGRFLLPVREGAEETVSHFRLDNYFTELKILPDSPFIGRTLDEIAADGHHSFTAVGWMRGGRKLRVPFSDMSLKEGDVLLVNATPEDIVAIRQEPGIELHPVAQYGVEEGAPESKDEDIEERLVQAVVAPAADIVGRTIRDIDFRWRYGAIVVGIWRREGFLRQELASIRLGPGDVLVLLGDADSLARVADDPAFLMMVPFHGELRVRRKAGLAGAIMLATIGVAALNFISLEIVTLAGATAMVLSGCITARQAYRAIDPRIYLFIAGAIPLGVAMRKSGTADLLANWLFGAVEGWSQLTVLLMIFAIAAVATQFLSDAATTLLFGPVAVVLAQAMGHPPEAYVVTVAMAAVVAFLTPIGHHGNLLIYGPGRYRFADFLRVGIPLTALTALVVAWLAPRVWPG
jgi:di/tricarboxylate transporter